MIYIYLYFHVLLIYMVNLSKICVINIALNLITKVCEERGVRGTLATPGADCESARGDEGQRGPETKEVIALLAETRDQSQASQPG